MAADTLDYIVEVPAPPAAMAKQIEEEFTDMAMKCGAATAYVKKLDSNKWRMVAEFTAEEIEGYAHFIKLFELPGLPPVKFQAKKVGGSA